MLLNKKRIPYNEIILFGILPNFLKILLLRIKGAKICSGVKISFGSLVLGNNIIIEKNVRINPFTVIIAESIEIGEETSIGSFCYFDLVKLKLGKKTRIRESVHVGGNKTPNSILKIGNNCLILQNVLLNTTDEINIDSNTAIGGGSKLFTHSSWLSILDGYPVIQGSIKIGNNVWVPYDTTILANVEIGEHVVILPRSVINRNIPSKSIVGGYPLEIKPNFYLRELKQTLRLKIFNKILNEIISIFEYEKFKLSSSSEDKVVLEKNNKYLIVLKTKDQLNECIKNKKLTKESCVLIFDEIKKNNIKNNDIAIIYLISNKPIVSNPNDLSKLILILLSRFGIR